MQLETVDEVINAGSLREVLEALQKPVHYLAHRPIGTSEYSLEFEGSMAP